LGRYPLYMFGNALTIKRKMLNPTARNLQAGAFYHKTRRVSNIFCPVPVL
jgi:hypothetical protein